MSDLAQAQAIEAAAEASVAVAVKTLDSTRDALKAVCKGINALKTKPSKARLSRLIAAQDAYDQAEEVFDRAIAAERVAHAGVARAASRIERMEYQAARAAFAPVQLALF